MLLVPAYLPEVGRQKHGTNGQAYPVATGRQAGLCVQGQATQGGMLLVPAYLPEVGRQKHGTNPGRQVVAFLCVLLPIADLLNCVIAEFLPAGPAAGGQAGRRYRPSGSDSNSGTSAM